MNDYVIRILNSPLDIAAMAWNSLLAAQSPDGVMNPFMRHEYLAALHESGSAVPDTGWTPRFITLWQGDALAGACALYLKDHSYGEYVFDHAWANAYQQHGLDYYPKALVASPFTPVPGARLLARNAKERLLLVKALTAWCEDEKLSSLHLLFANDDDVAACAEAGLMLRHTVQFHWSNQAPTLVASRTALPREGAVAPAGWQSQTRSPGLNEDEPAPPQNSVFFQEATSGGTQNQIPSLCLNESESQATIPFRDFDDFLMSLSQEKRKKIRQERRKVAEAGVTFRWAQGRDIASSDWDFFYKCYARTYYEHGNAPYLSRDFFQRMQGTMPENWLMFIAQYTPDGAGQTAEPIAIASSLIAMGASGDCASGLNDQNSVSDQQVGDQAVRSVKPFAGQVAYGRYWGALARVDCLHFEACYYQPLAWCIANGLQRFEGGAQGEHKMARALLPVKTTSAHWLAHPSFADAVERFLQREGAGIDGYMHDLESRSPYRQPLGEAAPAPAKPAPPGPQGNSAS